MPIIVISNIELGSQPANENSLSASSDIQIADAIESNKINSDNHIEVIEEQSNEKHAANNESNTEYDHPLTSKYKVITTSSFLNIREHPNASSTVIGKLETGSIVDVYEISEGWARVEIKNRAGFVSANFLDKINDTTDNKSKFNFSLNFLDSIDLSSIFPEKSDHGNLAFIISALIFILFIASKFRKEESHLDETCFLYIFNIIMILLITGLEIIYFIIDIDPIWFCSPSKVGWIMTIVNFFIFGFLVFQQISIYVDVFCDIRYNAYAQINLFYGILSWPIGLVAGIILSFFLSNNLVFIAFVAYQIGWVIFMFYKFASDGGIGKALLATTYYLVATIGTFMILFHFVILLIFAFIAYIVLQMIGSSKGQSSSNNSNSNDEGYDYSVTDEKGTVTKLKRRAGEYIGDDGSYWKDAGYGEVKKDD